LGYIVKWLNTGHGKGCAPDSHEGGKAIHLEEHPTKANGFYTRSLAAKFGTIEDLSVPRVREGSFRPSCLSPKRCTSLDLEGISKFLESLYGTFYSPAGIRMLSFFR